MKIVINWDEWLNEKESFLKNRGYVKFNQNLRLEDFTYWKIFRDENDNKTHMVGVLFYDFRKHNSLTDIGYRIEVMYQCILLGENRIDLTISKDITIDKFEEISLVFYNTMKKYME